jgi:hypothetical protein
MLLWGECEARMCRIWAGMKGRKRGREFQAGPLSESRRDEMTGMMEACRSRQYSLTKTQKVRAPIGWPLMPWCDHQKGVGRHLAMWRLSDRACGPQVKRSLTDGKELLCPPSEKRWQGWRTGYEIGGWRDGTSLTSPATVASLAQSSLASATRA